MLVKVYSCFIIAFVQTNDYISWNGTLPKFDQNKKKFNKQICHTGLAPNWPKMFDNLILINNGIVLTNQKMLYRIFVRCIMYIFSISFSQKHINSGLHEIVMMK